MGPVRFVILLDIEARTLSGAYTALYNKMKTLVDPGCQWESTDEVYYGDGTPVDADELQEIVMAVLAKGEK